MQAYSQTDCRERDSLNLVKLFDDWNGLEWMNPWKFSAPINTWEGIKISDAGCVTHIEFDVGDTFNNGGTIDLTSRPKGTIPTYISEFEDLEILTVRRAQLTGSIPPEIGELKNLTSLNLGGTELSGELPIELKDLCSIRVMSLDDNNLSGEILAELGELTSLRNLSLGGNNFTGTIPSELGGLLNLASLNLRNNNLSGAFPNELYNLAELKFLDVSVNQMSGTIDDDIQKMGRLTTLNIFMNSFSGNLPEGFFNLSELLIFEADHNLFSGQLPNTFDQLGKLFTFDMANNQLNGELPSSLRELEFLSTIALDTNQISGCFPDSYIRFCPMSGTFTDNLGLAWSGDFIRFCNGENQLGAFCDDGIVETENDIISDFCTCGNAEIAVRPTTNFCELDSMAEVTIANLFIEEPFTIKITKADESFTLRSELEANTRVAVFDMLSSGEYNFIILESATDQIIDQGDFIIDFDIPSPNFQIQGPESICQGQQGTLTVLTILEENFEWSTGESSREITIDEGGVYSLKITDENGCSGISRTEVIQVISPVAVDDEFKNLEEESITFNVLENDMLEGISEYRVDLIETADGSSITDLGEGEYVVVIEDQSKFIFDYTYALCNAKCDNFCDTASVRIRLAVPDLPDIIEAVITVNDDGKNDSFNTQIENLATNFPDNELFIYNRWGQEVYTTIGYDNDWKGRSNQNAELPEGTYYFVLRLRSINNDEVKGSVVLLR